MYVVCILAANHRASKTKLLVVGLYLKPSPPSLVNIPQHGHQIIASCLDNQFQHWLPHSNQRKPMQDSKNLWDMSSPIRITGHGLAHFFFWHGVIWRRGIPSPPTSKYQILSPLIPSLEYSLCPKTSVPYRSFSIFWPNEHIYVKTSTHLHPFFGRFFCIWFIPSLSHWVQICV
jgi:hypothetical protein